MYMASSTSRLIGINGLFVILLMVVGTTGTRKKMCESICTVTNVLGNIGGCHCSFILFNKRNCKNCISQSSSEEFNDETNSQSSRTLFQLPPKIVQATANNLPKKSEFQNRFVLNSIDKPSHKSLYAILQKSLERIRQTPENKIQEFSLVPVPQMQPILHFESRDRFQATQDRREKSFNID